MLYDINTISNFIIKEHNKLFPNLKLRNTRLQYLLYLSQCSSIIIQNKPLFADTIYCRTLLEPVVYVNNMNNPEIYNYIVTKSFKPDYDFLKSLDDKIDAQSREIIRDDIIYFSDKTESELEELITNHKVYKDVVAQNVLPCIKLNIDNLIEFCKTFRLA